MQVLANQQNMSSMSIIYILYGGLILYFLFKQFKGFREKQKIQSPTVQTFRKEVSKATYILGALIVAFGIFNIVNQQYISGALMIILVLVLFIDTRDIIITTKEGIYGQGLYIYWSQVRKWAFNLETSELVITYKDDMQEKTHYIKIEKNRIEELNSIIRKLRLGK